MDTWMTGQLGDFIELKRGYDLPKRLRKPGSVPIISSSGHSGWHDEVKVKAPGVVTGRYGTIGLVFYVETDFWPLNTALYVRDFKGNDPAFVHYFLKTLPFSDYTDKAAVPGVNRNHLHMEQVVLPPLPEQRRIAAVLGALDDKIELNRKMNRTLEEMAQAIFKSWFIDFDGVPDSEMVESELGPIPRGWEATTLGKVIDIYDKLRVPLSGLQRAQRKGPFPYYGAAAVMDYVDDYLFDGIYVLLGEDGSVVDGQDHPITQYVWGKFWVNNHAHVLLPKAPVGIEHLLLALRNANIRPYMTGAVQAKVSQGNLKRVPFVLPTREVCERFTQRAAHLFARLRCNTEESRTLAALRDALLPKLISGEVRVPEAEEAVEAVL